MTTIIIGGSSGLGRAIAEQAAQQGKDIIISARDSVELNAVAQDLRLRFDTVCHVIPFDINAEDAALNGFVETCSKLLNDTIEIFICVGLASESDDFLNLDGIEIQRLCATNFIQVAKLLLLFIKSNLETAVKKSATVISSIAAPIPRSRNIIYAASKTALESFCRSLQHATQESGWHIAICRLGYVDTAMSFGQKLLLPVASPQVAAKAIMAGVKSHKRLFYVPRFWRLIVFLLTLMPWCIFKKLKF